MKRLTVRVHGELERYLPRGREVEVAVDDRATLAFVQALLGIPPGEVGLFSVDQELVAEDAVARDGAVVDLFPLFGGG